jgi:hypothetical protein
MNRRRLLISVAGGLAALAVTGPAFAAEGASVKILPVAQLRATGAAVTLTVGVVCGPFDHPESRYLNLQVTQRVGGRIASGFGTTDAFACDGSAQEVSVSAPAVVGSEPFQAGVAFAQVTLGATGGAGEPPPLPGPIPRFEFQSAVAEADIIVSAP